MAEVTNQEPVLMLNDKKYIISELDPQAQYFVGQLNYVQQEMDKCKQELDRHTMAYNGFQANLAALLEDTEEPLEEG